MAAITSLANTADTKYAEVVNDSDAAATGINPENLKTLIHNIFIKVDEALAKTNTHTNDIKTTEEIEDIVGAMFDGGAETRISATYDDTSGKINLLVDDMNNDNNTTYAISVENGDNTDEEKIRITASTGGTDDIVLEAGTGLTIARDGDKITFTNTVTDTTYTVGDGGLTQNNFTNADHTKLNGISASADVTDATTVTAAGALMDSEVTNLSQVKAFDSSDYATAAQGSKADSAQQPPTEGAFANGDKTKLDGIEALATADQTKADINALDITEVGTITSGVWTGTAIADANIASASTWNAKQNAITFGIALTNIPLCSADVARSDFLKIRSDADMMEGRTAAQVKSDLSLNNVENTALSTFAGTSNITTLGTIATGTWNATAIADGKIASASTWNGKQSQLTFGLNDTDSIVIDGGAANNQFAHFTASGIAGLNYSSTKAKLDLDHLYTLVGAASDDAEHLGTFTGSTIADSQTIKQSLQALETAVESAGGASSLNGLSDVTFSSNDLTIPGLDKIIFDGAVDYDLSGDVTFTENGAAFSFLTLDYNQEKIKLLGNSGNTYLMATIFGTQASIACDDTIEIKANDIHFANSALGTFGWGLNSGTYSEYISWDVVSNTYQWSNSLDTDDYYKMTVGTHGATTLATVCDSGDNAANLTLDIDGDIELNADGGNITFKDNTADLAEISANGILSKTVVYFDAETANTIGNGATGAIDWTVNQKQKVTITGTGITCNFTNPPGPCNLTLKVVQGDGSDVIANWDGDIKWPSGTAPTLSTGNGAIDILSFYWDGTNYFGVASLDFQ